MNRTEQAYADYLSARELAGEIIGWRFEAYKLRLADNTWYTADFVVQLPNGAIQLHEVKACKNSGALLIEDDAAVKIKVAAETYPEFQFVLAGKLQPSSGGGWKLQYLR